MRDWFLNVQTQSRPAIPETRRPAPPLELFLLWIAGLTLVVAVSQQSLWIDEASTAAISSQGSLREWWQNLAGMRISDVQLPGYMFFMWGWVKVFGNSEWALRAAGLIWLVPGLVAMASGFARRAQRVAVMLVGVTSAFAWYYAGEARPYSMQLGVSCLIFAALHRLGLDELSERQQSRWFSGFLFGVLMLCGSSLLGVIWSIAALAAAFILIPRRRLLNFWKTGRLRLALTGSVLFVLGIYYLWTLMVGARATSVGRTDFKTIVFVFYEQFGLNGLGPGRFDLRRGGIETLRTYILPLTGYFVLTAIVAAKGIREAVHLEWAKRVRALALALAVPGLILISLGLAIHFRVLGRHCTPLMPVWFCLLALGLSALWARAGWMGRTILAAYLLLGLYSCLSIRFAARHERDDYRDAAQYAELALSQNQVVWWNADNECARYYEMPINTNAEEKSKATLVIGPSVAELAKLKKPDVIITSKPDIFDSNGALAEYLARNHYRVFKILPAFTIWRD
jgi:hypothetical protein